MSGILVRIKPGHKMDGEGEPLGKDKTGQLYTFWRSSGHMEIPANLAINLELERPQRFEIVDRSIADKIIPKEPVKTEPEIVVVEDKFKPETVKEEVIVPVVKDIIKSIPKPVTKVKETRKLKDDITVEEIKSMTKDEINDWAAKRDYDVKPRWLKSKMVSDLIKQIEKRTGDKVKKK